jgi:hypothetical protein
LFNADGGAVTLRAIGGVFEKLNDAIVRFWNAVISHGGLIFLGTVLG